MKYSENDIIIKEYREAFRKHAKKGIIDMDKLLKHKFSFQIHRLEKVIREWQGIIPSYRQSQFFVVLVKKGTGEKTIGHYSFPIQKNMIFVIPQRMPHSSNYHSVDCSGFFLSFDAGFFFQHFFPKHLLANKKIFKRSIKPFITLTPGQVEKLAVIFEYLLEEYNEQLSNKDEMIAIKVLELLIQSDRYFANAEAPECEALYNEVVESFTDLVQKNFADQRSVRFYADALHIHPNHLNFLMKKYAGTTAKQVICDHVLLEAIHQLNSSSLTVKEISYALGFDSPTSFSSFFKKRLNLSPAKYRQESS